MLISIHVHWPWWHLGVIGPLIYKQLCKQKKSLCPYVYNINRSLLRPGYVLRWPYPGCCHVLTYL